MTNKITHWIGIKSKGVSFNAWFVLSVAVTIFLIALLAWHLIYSNEMVQSFEREELAIQRVSGELLRYTNTLEMAANMAAATGDLKWEIEYKDYRSRLDELFETIPELVSTSEAQAEIDNIREYRQELDSIENVVLDLVARGDKREAVELLAGWVYTSNQLNIIIATEKLAAIMNDHINERIASEQSRTSILLWVLTACMMVLAISWVVTISTWRENVKKKQEKDEEVRYLSYHDSLTGLYNRAYLEKKMEDLDTEEHLPISIIMLDFNGLKLVNDTYGHSAGDEMLKNGAALLKRVCREADILARWGGDEFVILLPGTEASAVHKITERIIDECRKTYNDALPVSMALGAVTKGSPGEDLFAYLKEAEDRMYNHKLNEGSCGRDAALNALIKTLADTSYETENHTRRMKDIAILLAEKIGLSALEIERLVLLVALHDIGMINVPAEIFAKDRGLTEQEWVALKKHPEAGYRIARSTKEFAYVANEVLHHHENWDGSGYPEGLKGEEIPVLSRVIRVADAFEVMSSGRPYKQAMSLQQISAEFRACSEKQFDPALVEAALAILDNKVAINNVISR